MTASPYDAALSATGGHVENLAVWLAIWEARPEDAPAAHARRCASDAVDAIDGAIRELHKVRARLISEIRASDDATAIRADKLLARTDAMTSSNDQTFPGPSDPGAPGRALETPGPSEKEKPDEQE